MDRKTLNVLLIEDNPDYAELVQQWLSGVGEEVSFVLNWTDSLKAGLDRVSRGGVDVVLLDLGLPDSDGLQTFLATRAHAPALPVIILSVAGSESLALQMIQEGAEDYLVKSTCTGDQLVRTLRYAVVRRQASRVSAGAASEKARVIGVFGAKGGVGSTTVACSLAAGLRDQTGKEVLLADLDTNSALVSFLLGLAPKYSVRDAIDNVHRLDRACWEAIVTHGPGGLQIISTSGIPGDDELPVEGLGRVFNLVRPYYQWIVIDFGRLNGASLSLLDRVDELFVVTTTGLPALHEAKRMIDGLVSRGMHREHLRLIVNQAERVQTLSGSELKQLFGLPVYAALPHDGVELHRACLQSKLPAETTDVGRQFVNLARKVAGLPEERAKRNLPEFLSFVERFRKTSEATTGVRAD